LVTERLVGIVVADGLKVRGGVEMGREGSGKIEGKEVAIGVPGAEVPNDASSSGKEALLTDDDGRQLASEASGELIASTQMFEGVNDNANGIREFANGAREENFPQRAGIVSAELGGRKGRRRKARRRHGGRERGVDQNGVVELRRAHSTYVERDVRVVR
jgi:hypothetical protein